MKKETLLVSAVIALFLLNLGTLGFLLLRRPPPPPVGQMGPMGPLGRPGPGSEHGRPFDRVLIERLHLTADQIKGFDTMKHAHHEANMALDAAYDSTLRKYFEQLKDGATGKAAIEQRLTDIQRQKAAITFDHFAQLKRMCTADQQKSFDSLIPELIDVIHPHDRMPPPPPRDGMPPPPPPR